MLADMQRDRDAWRDQAQRLALAKTGAPDDVVAMAAVDGVVVGGGLGADH
jgi:hypothetical protein